jgi:DNA-binding NarL/FixJ family response regulator
MTRGGHLTRVVILEDHQLLAETLRSALQRSGVSARVAPLAPTLADVLADLLAEPAELVLLDLDLGDLGDPTALIPELVAAGLRVLVVTGSSDRLRIAAALEQGALGYQLKDPGFDALLATVRSALTATAPLDAEHRVQLLDELVRARAARHHELAPFARLTPREVEVLRALAGGSSVGALAEAWVVSEATMRSHVRSILGKLGVPSQLAAVAAALRTGWYQPSGSPPLVDVRTKQLSPSN